MNINFETGVKSYTVNGVDNAIRFNPADGGFLKRLLGTFERMTELQKNVSPDDGDSLESLEKFDADARAEIDALFGADTCGRIFGDVSLCSVAEGLPVWMNFLLAVMDECDEAISKAKASASPALQKYLKKYGK